MEKYSVNKDSLVLPPVSAPAEAFYGISPYRYRIEPEIIAVYQPNIGKPVHTTTKIPGTSS
jgi:hypothetical protein